MNIKDKHGSVIANVEKKEFGTYDFSGMNLTDADLSGLDLSNSDFSNAILRGAKMNDTEMSGSMFYRTDFSNANIFDSNLTSSDFRRANFHMATLAKSRFSNSVVHGICLHDADIRFADFDDCEIVFAGMSPRCRLIYATGDSTENIFIRFGHLVFDSVAKASYKIGHKYGNDERLSAMYIGYMRMISDFAVSRGWKV